MNIALGIHVKHDRGACLIIDGKVVANIANERLDRIKYSSSAEIPYESIDAILNYCDIDISDVSCIGFSSAGLESEKAKQFYKNEFYRHYKCSQIPFFFVSHHLAHAYSTYFSAPFDESLIFVSDGGGDYVLDKQEAETLYYGHNGKIEQLSMRVQDIAVRKMEYPVNTMFPFMPECVREHQISLARKYEQITHLIGFGFGQSGKTMGLASYGKPYFDYSDLNYENLNYSLKYRDIIEDIYAFQVISGKSHKDFIASECHNIAATLQKFTENSLVSLLKNLQHKYNCKNLCLAGGIFLNCLTNQKILCECNYDNVFILPAAGDDGQALGCAYYAYIELFGYKKKFEICLPYLGLSYSDNEIEQAILNKKLSYKKYSDEDLIRLVAKYISDNKIIGIHRGKTEIGPRALCHRSIIANPTNPKMKDILNSRVKHREEFRPFAPTVTVEDQFEIFDLKASSEYMLLAPLVKDEYREKIPSVTHVDNTARVQAISSEKDTFLHQLLIELKRVIGVPVILNTSFNVAGEPIVESPNDAINTFLKTNIDVLILENFVISKI